MTKSEKQKALLQIEKIFITGKGMPTTVNDPIFVALQKMIEEVAS